MESVIIQNLFIKGTAFILRWNNTTSNLAGGIGAIGGAGPSPGEGGLGYSHPCRVKGVSEPWKRRHPNMLYTIRKLRSWGIDIDRRLLSRSSVSWDMRDFISTGFLCSPSTLQSQNYHSHSLYKVVPLTEEMCMHCKNAVSYTHLTLPTMAVV